jgi:hypothetical protein
MPGAHRHADSRFCGATTTVVGQNAVVVENRLWAVQGDPNTHGQGLLIASYGDPCVTIAGKLVICAVGDTAGGDRQEHSPGQTDPKGHSNLVVVYGGAAGGGK